VIGGDTVVNGRGPEPGRLPDSGTAADIDAPEVGIAGDHSPAVIDGHGAVADDHT
jgi:hypothetical protein